MASPKLFDPAGATEAGVVYAFLEFTTTTNGGVPAALTRSRGITSVVRNATGKYTITFSQQFNALLAFNCTLLEFNHPGAKAFLTPTIISRNMQGSPPTVVIQFYNVSEGGGEITDGASCIMMFVLKNAGF